MKNRAAYFIVILLLISFLTCCAQGDTRSFPQDLDCFARALYENKDMGTSHNLNHYLEGESLKIYLEEKVAIHQLVTKNNEKVNYQVETEVKEIQALGGEYYYIALAVRVSFNYANMQDTDSGYGEVMQIIVHNKNENLKVLDFYVQHDYFDTEVRGNEVDLKSIYHEKQSPQFPDKAEIVGKVRVLKERLEPDN